jgi:prefoldin subunit 5
VGRHSDINTSYGLEHHLAQSIEKMRDNITRSHKLKQEIVKLRRQRRQLEAVPDEVKQWFEDVEDLDGEGGDQ